MLKVLVVDDNPMMRRLLINLLSEFDPVVHECGDGIGALVAYQKVHPDLVLMDIEMPLQDGLTSTRQILDFDPKAVVVIVTKYRDERIREKARQAGACNLLEKENLLRLTEVVRFTLGLTHNLNPGS